jgi:Tfp pilus assembly protein PilF
VTERPEIAEAGAEPAPGVDPAAMTMALGVASRERADNFLEEQTRLVRLQAEELSHELDVRRWSLWVRHLSGLLKLTLEIGLAVVGLGIAAFIAAAIWNAAHAEGLVIEPFSVPPDLANQGITGQVVASQMLDQLTIMQNSTQSARPARSYINSWGDDLKVEIPETGVSVGEAYRFLRRWLGHETHVSGEVIRTPTGIAVTARTGGSSGATVRGAESDLDALIVRSAEQIYRITQPDRYARYLFFPRPGLTTPRFDEARAILDQMARDAAPAEKRWAWTGLGVLARYQLDYRAASIAYRKAATTNTASNNGLGVVEAELSHPEFALSMARDAKDQLDRGSYDVDPSFVDLVRSQNGYLIASLLGDHSTAATLALAGVDLAGSRSLGGRESFHDKVIYTLGLLHDGARMRAYWRSIGPPPTPVDNAQRMISRLRAEGALEHYQAVVASESNVEKTAIAVGNGFTFRDVFETQLRPSLALARARLGDIAGAQALIAPSPDDCYDCVRTRAQIAEAAKQPTRAGYWFAQAIKDAPSIPFAYSDWGQSLLARGKPEEAIEKFKLANQKAPHFADPLVYWGEALMAKNRSHLALAKFAEAEKYAPNWGRLHLKWGEALAYAGKRDEAAKQFARAAALDLTPSEKSELTGLRRN